MIVTGLYMFVFMFLIGMAVILVVLDRRSIPDPPEIQDVHAVLIVKQAELVPRVQYQVALIRRYMQFTNNIFIINYTGHDLDLAVNGTSVVPATPGTDTLTIIQTLPGEAFYCLYDNIFPVRTVYLSDFISDRSQKRRCFGLGNIVLLLMGEPLSCEPVLLIVKNEIGQCQSINHYLLGRGVMGDIVVNEKMCEEIFLIQENEDIQLDSDNWDRLFLKVNMIDPEHETQLLSEFHRLQTV
jgi:hypothetical protein